MGWKIAYVGYKLITEIYWLSLGKVSQCLWVFILQYFIPQKGTDKGKEVSCKS